MRLFSTLRILPRSGKHRLGVAVAPCLAEPPAESPSTTNSSARLGSLTEQSASLPGSVEFSSADLRRVRSRALRAASRARCAWTAFMITARASLGFSSRNSARPAVDDRLDEAGHAWIAELGLGLTLELRVAQLDRDDGRQSLAHVIAGEVVLFLLEQTVVAGVLVERAREGGAKARHVRATLARVDVVGERVDRLLIGGVPLHRDLGGALVALAREEHDLAMNCVLVLVEIGHEVLDSTLVLELSRMALATLVGDRDLQSAREEGGLAQTLLERVEVEVERLEDVGVGQGR